MRAIDASLFAVYSFKTPDGYDDDSYTAGVGRVLEDMDEAPILDYKDLVPQGEWIVTEEIPGLMKSVECSACHCKTTYCKPRFNDIRLTSFCPDCGARMTK